MRLFYAAYLSRETMAAYQALVDRLIEQQPAILRSVPRWTHHLTLAFLGDIDDELVPECESALQTVADHSAFEFSLQEPRILMGRGRPRLIHAGVSEGQAQIQEVQRDLIGAVGATLPNLDLRPKPPHVTLARFHKRAAKPQARTVERALAQIDPATFPTDDRFAQIELVASTLRPQGPVYETLLRIELAE